MSAELIRVLVVGAAGSMGRQVTAAVRAEAGLEAVGGLDLPGATGPDGLPLYSSVAAAVSEARPHVAVDFTHADAARANLPQLIASGVAAVIGTTGLSDQELAEYDQQAKAVGTPLFLAPNFAVGAVLMMRFAAEAARHFAFAEIIEYHHENKRDAPSGTAAKTLERMLASRGGDFSDTPVDEKELLPHSRGGQDGFVRVHSVRMPGFVADQDVILGSSGETLRISHRTTDRGCFMPGVMLAVQRVRDLPAGLTVGLERLLFDD